MVKVFGMQLDVTEVAATREHWNESREARSNGKEVVQLDFKEMEVEPLDFDGFMDGTPTLGRSRWPDPREATLLGRGGWEGEIKVRKLVTQA